MTQEFGHKSINQNGMEETNVKQIIELICYRLASPRIFSVICPPSHEVVCFSYYRVWFC